MAGLNTPTVAIETVTGQVRNYCGYIVRRVAGKVMVSIRPPAGGAVEDDGSLAKSIMLQEYPPAWTVDFDIERIQ